MTTDTHGGGMSLNQILLWLGSHYRRTWDSLRRDLTTFIKRAPTAGRGAASPEAGGRCSVARLYFTGHRTSSACIRPP